MNRTKYFIIQKLMGLGLLAVAIFGIWWTGDGTALVLVAIPAIGLIFSRKPLISIGLVLGEEDLYD